jgi:hypothetical protein
VCVLLCVYYCRTVFITAGPRTGVVQTPSTAQGDAEFVDGRLRRMTAAALTVRPRYRLLRDDEENNGNNEVDCARWSGAQCTARCCSYPLLCLPYRPGLWQDVREAPREPSRTRKPLDTSWASIGECAARRSARPCAPEARLAAEPVCLCPSGRDLVEVCRRLPADVAYLLNRCHPRTRVPISGRL